MKDIATQSRIPISGWLVAICVALSACDGVEEADRAIARVNGRAISDMQLRLVASSNKPQSRNEALQSLIDNQLLEAEAKRQFLDRDPYVAAALAQARTKVLAEAYIARQVALQAKPSRAEVDAYYDQNPERFAKRKLFDFHLLALPPGLEDAEVRRVVDMARSLDDVAAWLDGKSRAYLRNRLSRPIAELPPMLAARLAMETMHRPFLVVDKDKNLVVEIADISTSPMTREDAQQLIERELSDRKRKEIASDTISRLRADAKLEYLDRKLAKIAESNQGMTQSAHFVPD